jgi:hypothetical protein
MIVICPDDESIQQHIDDGIHFQICVIQVTNGAEINQSINLKAVSEWDS